MLKKTFVCIVFLILTGCNTCTWIDATYEHSFSTIWDTTYKVISKRYHISKASLEERTIETDWDVQVSIHYLDGYRNKVYAKIEDYEEPKYKKELDRPMELEENDKTKKKYVIKICVLQEQNRNLDNPSVAQEADWYTVGNNTEEARKLINFIRSRLNLLIPPKNEKDKDDKKLDNEFAPKQKW